MFVAFLQNCEESHLDKKGTTSGQIHGGSSSFGDSRVEVNVFEDVRELRTPLFVCVYDMGDGVEKYYGVRR